MDEKFGIIFSLMALSLGSQGSTQEGWAAASFEDKPVYTVTKIRTDPIPSLFSGGEVFVSGKNQKVNIPLPKFGYESPEDGYPWFIVVGNRENFSLYQTMRTESFLKKDKSISYSLFPIYRMEGNVEGTFLDPFKGVFDCKENVPLCLHVVLSPLYDEKRNTQEKLEDAYKQQGPLTIKFEEI